MQPRIVSREAFRVAGLKCRASMQNNTAIPQLWDQFTQRCGDITHPLDPETCLGICYPEPGDTENNHETFSYLAGMEVGADEPLPAGMEALELPAAEYAIFEHHGALDDLRATYTRIYGEWLPQSGFQPSGNLDFELYDQRFRFGQPDSVLEIWVPVRKA